MYMEYYEAGTALSYAIGNELIHEKDNRNLKAFLIYFAITNRISMDVVDHVRDILDIKELQKPSKLKAKFRAIMEPIVSDLKKTIHFRNEEELFSILNKIIIPEWVFNTCEELFEIAPEIYIYKDRIYYIDSDNGSNHFRCVTTGDEMTIKGYSNDLQCEYNIRNRCMEKVNYTLSNKYSHILGFNKVNNHFYLRLKYTDEMYAEYYPDTNTEIIRPVKLIGLMGEFPVCRNDGKISVKVGHEIKSLMEYNPLETYSVMEDHIYVMPRYGMPTMFRPYKVFIDGEIVKTNRKEATQYVISAINRDVILSRMALLTDSENVKDDVDEIVLNIEYLKKYLEIDIEHCCSKEMRVYYFLLKLLSKYYAPDEDILDLLYILSDISKKSSDIVKNCFISESLYFLLEELEMAGKLNGMIKDINKLQSELMQRVYWTEEEIKNKYFRHFRTEEYIGFFSLENESVDANKCDIKDGIIIGDTVMGKNNEGGKEGCISYSIETGLFTIQYPRELSEPEKVKIMITFNLATKPCLFRAASTV